MKEIRWGKVVKTKFGNVILRMWRGKWPQGCNALTPEQSERKRREFVRAELKAQLTRRQWTKLWIETVIAKNKENGLGMCGGWRKF